MKPIDFPESTILIAKNQKEYETLPAYKNETETISRWRFTWRERLRILFGAGLWIRQMNFGEALQPQLPQIETPFTAKDATWQRKTTSTNGGDSASEH